MTLQQTLNNLPKEQKDQTKKIIFQQGSRSQQLSFADNILAIYIYDYDSLKGDLDLSPFTNLMSINFQYNVCTNLLENIDISKNKNLNRIILGKGGECNPLRESNAFLTIKKSQLSQIVVFYTYYSSSSWHSEYKLLKKQPVIPYVLVEEKEKDLLEAEVKELREKINSLQKQAEQKPTLDQFKELSNLVLFSDYSNFEELKEEIRKLKLKDFTPFYQEKKENFKKLTKDCEASLSEELKSTLKLLLDTNIKILESKESQENLNDPAQLRAQGQLDGQMVFCKTFLQHKLSDEKLQNLLKQQEEFLQTEKKFASLQGEEQQVPEIVQNTPPVYRP